LKSRWPWITVAFAAVAVLAAGCSSGAVSRTAKSSFIETMDHLEKHELAQAREHFVDPLVMTELINAAGDNPVYLNTERSLGHSAADITAYTGTEGYRTKQFRFQMIKAGDVWKIMRFDLE
jgi:hypothetical protein